MEYTRRNPPPKRRRKSRVTLPEHVSSEVKLMFIEMRRQNLGYDALEELSGVRRPAMKTWRHRSKPSLESLQATLGVLGFDFVPVPRAKVLPSELVAELQPIAERFALDLPQTIEALTAIVAGIHASQADLAATRSALPAPT